MNHVEPARDRHKESEARDPRLREIYIQNRQDGVLQRQRDVDLPWGWCGRRFLFSFIHSLPRPGKDSKESILPSTRLNYTQP